MSDVNVGKELIRLGWTQGSLIDIADCPDAALSWNARTAEPPNGAGQSSSWEICHTPVRGHNCLVVTSHPCDIMKPEDNEPYVEAVPAHWTSDPIMLGKARPNSIRYHKLQKRKVDKGTEWLVDDAAHKMLIRKSALLELRPERGIAENDPLAMRDFKLWLVRRYDRPALPDQIVQAFQQPIVDAYTKLSKNDPKRQALEGIREVLFWAHVDQSPIAIDLCFLLDERCDPPIVNQAKATQLAGWMGNVLTKSGRARIAHWEMQSVGDISLGDYMVAYKIPLDEYSPLMQTILSASPGASSSLDEPAGL